MGTSIVAKATSATLVAAIALLWPTVALAQNAIGGLVKDTSGGVLPGVTVEASSDALIEGTKVATADGSGLYKIIDLRPGTYTVVFSLTNFATVKHTNVELQADSTTTVNAELVISEIEETIIVTGKGVSLVDVQSAARVQTLSKDIMDNVPTSRTIQTMGQLIVGVSISLGSPDVGGSNGSEQTYMTVRGIPSSQNTVMVDGMVVNGLEGSGAVQGYQLRPALGADPFTG